MKMIKVPRDLLIKVLEEAENDNDSVRLNFASSKKHHESFDKTINDIKELRSYIKDLPND